MIGLFVLGGLIALAGLIVKFGMSSRWLNTYSITMYFPTTGSIRGEDLVLINGVDVGTVATVELKNRADPAQGVAITAHINQEYDIPANTTPRILAPGLAIGARGAISLDLSDEPTSPVTKDGTGKLPTGVFDKGAGLIPPEIITQIGKAVDAIESVAQGLLPVEEALYELIQQRPISEVEQGPETTRLQPNVSTLVQRIDETVRNLSLIIGDSENRENIKGILANMKTVSEQLPEMVEQFKSAAEKWENAGLSAEKLTGDVRETTKTVNLAVERFGERAIAVAVQFEKLLKSADNAIDGFTKEDGTVGRLVGDSKLYDELVITMQKIQKTVEDLGKLAAKWRDDGVKLR
jgi:phospholipid/cholesterol/gamma-HCH transport system substrate-binding protein